MTKLGLLNAYLTERLMVVVREILEVVEGTVSEYQEEAARTHRENEKLRRRLREVGLDTIADWSGEVHSLSVSSPVEEQHGEQDWSSGLREELSLNEEEQLPCASQRERSCDPGLIPLDYDGAGSLLPAPRVKSDEDDACGPPPDLLRIRTVDCGGAYSPPPGAGLEPGAIKTEPSEVYCVPADLPARLLPQEPEHLVGALADIDRDEPPLLPPPPPLPLESRRPSARPGRAYRSTPHSCPHCSKTFRHVSRLKIHLRIHTGEKPFSCALCGKSFNNDGTLKNHQRVHTQVRLYSCAQCGMSFKDAYTCKKHQRVHTGEKPYACVHCGKHFNEVGNLQTHIRTHTGERPYCCSLCGKRFLESGKLKKHLRIHARAGAQS